MVSGSRDKGEAVRQVMQQRSWNEFELTITKTFGLKDLTNKTHCLSYASANRLVLYSSSFRLGKLLLRFGHCWLPVPETHFHSVCNQLAAVANLKIEKKNGCLTEFVFIAGPL